MDDILSKTLRREMLSQAEALALWERVPLQELAAAADEVRRAVMIEAREAEDRAAGEGNYFSGEVSGDRHCSAEGSLSGSVGGRGMPLASEWKTVAHPDAVSWQIDRNVNITNVCISGCKFCNFHCRPADTERAYVLTVEDYIPRIEEMLALGGDQLLLQGGLHPRLDIDFYTGLFSELKRLYPALKLHALGAPEVAHIARISGLGVRETLERLVEAGLDSLPGAGAEILVSEVRRAISPAKPSVEEWCEVMREAHRMNLPTSATMMYGHIESPRHIVRHLLTIRDLQAERPRGTHGFVAFIPWIFRGEGTVLEREMRKGKFSSSAYGHRPEVDGAVSVDGLASYGVRFSPLEYLRVIALSRLVLCNIRNIQASWLTVGRPTAQLALHSGANDMGSIMIEEKVVSSAGARNRFDAERIQAAIREAGFTPVLRDQLYRPR